MPVNLATLFCQPQDVWDLLSVEGVDLREDDSNLATGQIITTSADTPAGSATVAVHPLLVPLLAGEQLTFLQGGMDVPQTVQLAAPAGIGSTILAVVAVEGPIPAGAQARDSGVNAATGARLKVGCRKGTSRVKLYCNARYDDSQLALSGSVCDWATVIAARWLCMRRAQGVPKSLAVQYDEFMDDLKMVQAGALSIEDIGTRGVDWPTVVNITVNPSYDYMRARVQPNMSEQTPTAYGQFIDWNSAALVL